MLGDGQSIDILSGVKHPMIWNSFCPTITPALEPQNGQHNNGVKFDSSLILRSSQFTHRLFATFFHKFPHTHIKRKAYFPQYFRVCIITFYHSR